MEDDGGLTLDEDLAEQIMLVAVVSLLVGAAVFAASVWLVAHGWLPHEHG